MHGVTLGLTEFKHRFNIISNCNNYFTFYNLKKPYKKIDFRLLKQNTRV